MDVPVPVPFAGLAPGLWSVYQVSIEVRALSGSGVEQQDLLCGMPGHEESASAWIPIMPDHE